MRASIETKPQLADCGDVRLRKNQAADAELGDSRGQDVLLEARDGLEVQVLDGDQRGALLPGQHFYVLLVPAELVDAQDVDRAHA